MLEPSNSFSPYPILIRAIFAIKYAVQMLNARAETATATDADRQLATLEKTAGDMEHCVAHVEAILKEVE